MSKIRLYPMSFLMIEINSESQGQINFIAKHCVFVTDALKEMELKHCGLMKLEINKQMMVG